MEKITYVKIDNTDREGNQLMSRQGKPYSRQTLKVESKGDRFISGFLNANTRDIKVGDELDITIVESDKLDKNGKPYLNWSLPKPQDKVDDKLEQILNKLVGLQLSIGVLTDKLIPKKTSNYPVNDLPEPFPDDSGEEEPPF